jgi:hypothetical protein
MPYMDCKVSTSEIKIEWCVYVKPNITQKLSNKEVKELKLNELFDAIELNEKNGNA